MPDFLFTSWIDEYYIKTAGERDNKLLILPERVTATSFATGYIIYPIGSCDIERYVAALFYERQIPPCIQKFG